MNGFLDRHRPSFHPRRQARSIADMARTAGKREGTLRMSLMRLRQVLRACVEHRLAKEQG